MEITQNQTNTTETPNINPPLAESGITEKTIVPKRRFRLPRLSPRTLLVSFLVLLLLLVLGLGVVAAVKNTFKKAFEPSLSKTLFQEKQTQQPSLTSKEPTTTPQVQVPKNSFPAVCQQNYNSSECTRAFNELVKKNCNFDINIRQIPVTEEYCVGDQCQEGVKYCVGDQCQEGVKYCVGDQCQEESESLVVQDPEAAKIMACVNKHYRQLGQIACGQDNSSIDCQCSKDPQPLFCLFNKLADIEADKISKSLSNLHLTILCPMKEAFDQTLGFGPFDGIDCSGDYPGKQTTAPQTP